MSRREHSTHYSKRAGANRVLAEVTRALTIGAHSVETRIAYRLCYVRASCDTCRRESQVKEELMVSNDVMRLEVKRLRDTLNGAADEVFSLENRRQQMAMSMKERKAEIQVILADPA